MIVFLCVCICACVRGCDCQQTNRVNAEASESGQYLIVIEERTMYVLLVCAKYILQW